MIRFTTAGESHGRAIVALLEGVPAGLSLAASDIDADLARRMLGHGRGARTKTESTDTSRNSTRGAPGGGTVSRRHVLLLQGRPGAAAARLGGSAGRPLIEGAESAVRLTELLAKRKAGYLAADHVVETDCAAAEQVARDVASLARGHAGW